MGEENGEDGPFGGDVGSGGEVDYPNPAHLAVAEEWEAAAGGGRGRRRKVGGVGAV